MTSVNKEEVTGNRFVYNLREQGCGLIFYVEYVPAKRALEYLILSDGESERIGGRISMLRETRKQRHDYAILSW